MASVTLVCCHARQPDYLARLIDIHEPYPWVSSIVAFDTSQALPFTRRGKVLHCGRDFGYGFDKQPEQGGYDEINARQTALKIARGENHFWSLIVDADEIYHPGFDRVLDVAEGQGSNAVCVECWPLVTPQRYVYNREAVFDIDNLRLHDPHVRAISKLTEVTYTPSPQHWRFANRTQHCRPDSIAKTHTAPGFYHFHVKRHDFQPEQLRTLPESLPEAWFARS